MSKKTWRHRSKTIKNREKQPKTIEIGRGDVNLTQKGVFLPFFVPIFIVEGHDGYPGGYLETTGTHGGHLGGYTTHYRQATPAKDIYR